MSKLYMLVLCLCCILHTANAQLIPVIKAITASVDIRDGNDFQKGNWHVSPEVKQDIFYTGRSKKIKRVSFITDIDSISFLVEPGKKYDFIILLNGKDSARTEIYAEQPPALPYQSSCINCHGSDTIPFTLGKGDKVFIQGSINGSAPLHLMFDLGSNQVVLSKKAIAKGVDIHFTDLKYNVAFGGTTELQTSTHNSVTIGSITWKDISIALADQADGDGIIGYNLMDGRILEINYDRKIMVLSQNRMVPPADYTALPVYFKSGLPFVEVTLVGSGKTYKQLVEFDGGANGALWLNQSFVNNAELSATLPKIGNSSSRGLGNNRVKNEMFLLPAFELAGFRLKNVPVSIEQHSDKENLHHPIMGMDIIKRFNIVIDFQQDSVYLRPNLLYNVAFHRPWPQYYFYLAGIFILILVTFLTRRKIKMRV